MASKHILGAAAVSSCTSPATQAAPAWPSKQLSFPAPLTDPPSSVAPRRIHRCIAHSHPAMALRLLALLREHGFLPRVRRRVLLAASVVASRPAVSLQLLACSGSTTSSPTSRPTRTYSLPEQEHEPYSLPLRREHELTSPPRACLSPSRP
nr:unnamed protein product [Digitaria exilis]